MTKPSVYLETSFISYLTARPSRDLIVAGHQAITAEWWENRRHDFELFISPVVYEEVSRGDPQAATKRIAMLSGIISLEMSESVFQFANLLINNQTVPEQELRDALHIAAACVNGITYLLTWNCRHIANAEKRGEIDQLCIEHNYVSPIICTPEELLGG